MANSDLYMQSGRGTHVSTNTSNINNPTIQVDIKAIDGRGTNINMGNSPDSSLQVDIDADELCTSTPSSSIFISYGTKDPSDVAAQGKIYIKYKV